MSSTDHQAKYERRKALRDKVETYWLEEAKRECESLEMTEYQDHQVNSMRR